MTELDREQARKFHQHFYAPPPGQEMFVSFEPLAAVLTPQYSLIAAAFRHSVEAALSTVSIPFFLAFDRAQSIRFQKIHILARMRTIRKEPSTASFTREHDRLAHEEAQLEMNEFMKSAEGTNAMVNDTTHFLLGALERDDQNLAVAARELLQQGLILVWSAFEVLFRDAFEALLNEHPAKVAALIEHPTTRKRFEAERLPLDTLVQHGFDLSQRLGSVLVTQQDFSDLLCVKAVYDVLFPAVATLHDALADRELWMLFQRRHLIVHRRGVVDRTYVNATGEEVTVGSSLAVRPDGFERAVSVVVSAGTALLGTLRDPVSASD